MSEQSSVPVTQRAYTLKLRGVDPNDNSWRDALWATHEAVNKGAKAFGDWLLTLRGGLDHNLASNGSTRDRRVVLALGWLSVEDAEHAPAEFRVATGAEVQSARNDKVLAELRAILTKRSVSGSEIDEWVNDCQASLCSAIREDAVWVDRSAAFDAVSHLSGLTRDHAQHVVADFVGDLGAFLALPATEGSESAGPTDQEEKAKDFVKKACGWLSFNCGEDERSDKATLAANLSKIVEGPLDEVVGKSGNDLVARIASILGIQNTGDSSVSCETIRDRIGWRPGPDSKGLKAIRAASAKALIDKSDIDRLKEKLRDEATARHAQTSESPLPWAAEFKRHIEGIVGFAYTKTRFAVMLDHALRRFSSTHTWMRRAEAQRCEFEEDARKIEALRAEHARAVEWLDRFCERQSHVMAAAADGGYRMRRRALGGRSAKAWKAVVEAWWRVECATEQDRIEAAGQVQSEWDEDEKFGHADLFEQLADDDAVCVWRPEGAPNPQILIDYVAAATAAFDRVRFRVPMYRHPDPFKHPVFCDFGNSRWAVHFEAHKTAQATTISSTRRSHRATDLHAVKLQALVNGAVESQPFRWASKRLDQDLAIGKYSLGGARTPVTRASRLGRAAAQVAGGVEIMNVFTENEWNGRLQVPRRELEHVARLIDSGNGSKADRAKQRLHWLLTFSPRLQPKGPWLEYGVEQGLYRPDHDIQVAPRNDRDDWRGLAYPIWHLSNEKGRTGLAKHILSRFSGVRILSVDLGHRFAAACAVWETVRDINNAVLGKVMRGGIGPRDLFAHVQETGQDGKPRTVIYRRVGPDTLADGNPNPAPWARLERQFLIKLQGEERPARAASKGGPDCEVDGVRQFAERHGNVVDDDPQNKRGVDELMRRVIRVATLALRRHGRRAKIAWALDPATRSVFGMGGREGAFEVGDDAHIKLLTDTLFDWHALATDSKWDDEQARDLWNRHIPRLAGAWKVEEPRRDPNLVDERTRQQRRKDEDAVRERLKPIAKALAETDRSAIHLAWGSRWEKHDGPERDESDFAHRVTTDESGRNRSTTSAKRAAAGWHADLRWLTDWIMGWRLVGVESKLWTRNVGGLSVTRIATMRSLYQLHKAFAMRPRPEKPRGAPEKGESNAGVAQGILDAMERMREQRVKQLASRIAAAALGLGGHWKKVEVPKRSGEGELAHRPDGTLETKARWVWVEEASPKYHACHVVVIENLTNYRPDELQTRRENRQLMQWSSSKVRKYLSEACQLHGLHLREVSPAYTSRQDSRTGKPGVRCSDVSVEEFLRAPRWRKQVNQAKKKREGERTARESYLLDLDQRSSELAVEQRRGKVFRVPVRGGHFFVSAGDLSNAGENKPASGIQADLNAAANIGLKALTDPDWSGRWWYVPCSTSDGKPTRDKVGGCPVVPLDRPLRSMPAGTETKVNADRAGMPASKPTRRRSSTRARSTKEIVNYWRDPVSEGKLSDTGWRQTKHYWADVEERVVARLRQLARLDAKG